MEKITLKLFEFYNLDAELNGVVNQQTGEKVSNGLVQEKLSLVVKYWLTDLAKKVKAERDAIEELKNELIRKYGKADDRGGISIPVLVDQLDEDGKPVMTTSEDGTEVAKKIVNPDYQSFEKDFNDLLNTEKEIEYKSFSLDDFDKVETADNYATFFKLIKVEEPKMLAIK